MRTLRKAALSESRIAAFSLVALATSFLAFESQLTRRVTNNVWADVEFSGWTAAIAHQVVLGRRLYGDFTLPIPPGSITLLAFVERIAGHPAMLHEAWLCAVCHLAMGLLAYFLTAPLTSRANALMVSGLTLALVIQLPKELAYDHTAQVVAWGAFVMLVRSLVATGARRATLSGAAGFLAGLTFFFKQSTGIGVVLGCATAYGFTQWMHYRVVAGGASEQKIEDVRWPPFLGGVALGAAATLCLVACVSSLPGYLETVFVEGPKLKGGSLKLAQTALVYVFQENAVRLPGLALVVSLAALRLGRQRGPALASTSAESLGPQRALGIALISAGTFLVGAYRLATSSHWLESLFSLSFEWSRLCPALGLVAGALAIWWWPAGESVIIAGGRRALFLGALTSTVLHNLSAAMPRFFYDNNLIIPVTVLFFLLTLDACHIACAKWVVFAALMLSSLGGKADRALHAETPASNDGFWRGLRVNERGAEVQKAAMRASELTTSDETVLVLPEDPTLATLVGRPRPRLCGAIVFVDQYPARCAEHDLRELEQHPPKVVLVQPLSPSQWRPFWAQWSSTSPASGIVDKFLDDTLPRHYRLDSTYPTYWGITGERAMLGVYVRTESAP